MSLGLILEKAYNKGFMVLVKNFRGANAYKGANVAYHMSIT